MKLELSGGRSISTKRKSFVMGILNTTPDSFFPGSRVEAEEGRSSAEKMIHAGADIIDIGGESSRPGSAYVSADEEISRVIPLIKAIRSFSDIPISIDTRKSATAEAALNAGADIINDISALADDPELGFLAAERDVPLILMHMRGTPETMQQNPHYNDTIEEILTELEVCIRRAGAYGISKNRIILDPGIGFGKRLDDNLKILKEIKRFTDTGYPILIGLSRKSFIGAVTGSVVEDRLSGTLAANMLSALAGASILRVHDVPETVAMLEIIKAVEGA